MMFAILPKISVLVFLPLACQYNNSLSSWSEHLKRTNSVAEISHLRNSRLLLVEVDTELESACDSESNFRKNKERNPEDRSDVETVYEESLTNDKKKEISLQDGQNLSYFDDKHILEKNENKGILKYQEHEEEIKENQELLNFLKQKITNLKTINIADHTKMFGETVKKIKSMKEKMLSAGMINVMEYQKGIDEGLEMIKSMKEEMLSAGMTNVMEYQKGIDEGLEKIKSIKEKALSAGIANVVEYQKMLDEGLEKIKSMKEKALSAGMTNVVEYQKMLDEGFEKIKSMKEKALNAGMTNVMEYEKGIDEGLEKIKSMKEKMLSAGMSNVMEYQKRLDEGLEKINMIKEKLMKQKIMNAEISKMLDYQKALIETRDFIKTKYNAIVPSAVDSIKSIREGKVVVPNPVGMLDSRIEKKLFKTYSYMDECEHNPNISKNQFRLMKIKKYGFIIALPFIIALSGMGFLAEESLNLVTFGFLALSFIISFYNLVKVLKYDLKSHNIRKPLFKDYVKSFIRCIK